MPKTFSFRITSEGATQVIDTLKALSATSKEAEAALATLTQSSPQLASANDRAQKSLKDTSDKLKDVGGAGKVASTALRSLAVQAPDVFSGLATGQPVMTILIQQGQQVAGSMLAAGVSMKSLGEAAKGAFSPVTIALAAISAATIGFGAASEIEARRINDISRQLRLTRDDYDLLGVTIDRVAKQVASTSSLGASEARDAGKIIASNPAFSGLATDLDKLIRLSGDLGRAMGGDAAEGAQKLAAVQSNAGRVVRELADQGMRGLNEALVRQVELLERSGQRSEAMRQATDAISRAVGGTNEKLTPLQTALRNLTNQFTSAGSDGKSLADVVGTSITGAAAAAVDSIAALITKIREFRDAANDISKAPQTPGDWLRAGLNFLDPNFGAAFDRHRVTAGYIQVPSTGQVPQSYNDMRDRIAREYGVDPEIARRLNGVEGQYRDGRWQVSSAGARGGFQLLPGTFADVAKRYGIRGSIDDDEANARAGILYYREQLRTAGGDPALAYLGYHDGPGIFNRGAGRPSQAGLDAAGRLVAGYSGQALQRTPGAEINSLAADARLNVNAQLRASTGTIAQRQDVGADVDATKRAISDLLANGAKESDDSVRRLQERLGTLQGTLTGIRNPVEELRHSLGLQAQASTGADGAAKELNQTLIEGEEAAKRMGRSLTADERMDLAKTKLAELAGQYAATLLAVERQVAGESKLGVAYDQGARSVIEATNRIKAEEEARKTALEGTGEYASQVGALTAAYNRLSAAQADNQTASRLFEQGDQLETIRLQTDLLGQNVDVQNRELALLRERQALLRQGANLDSERSRQSLANVGRIAEETAAYERQRQTLTDFTGGISSAYDTLSTSATDAFVKGEAASVSFKSSLQGIETQIVALISRLTILNPLLNAIDGGNRSTLTSAVDSIGRLLGGSSGGAFSGAGIGGSSAGVSAGFGTGSSIPSSYVSSAAGVSSGFGGFSFANGGIMTSAGSIPLNRYESGGIANRPQLALFGEGRSPEAYVPLPDGRTIPVTMRGGQGGTMVQGGDVHVHVAGSNASPAAIATMVELASQRANERLLADINRGGRTARMVGRRR